MPAIPRKLSRLHRDGRVANGPNDHGGPGRGAVPIPTHGSNAPAVLLGSLDEALWRDVIRFAYAHDITHAPPECLSFDAVSGMPKPYTGAADPTLDDGFHAMFSPSGDAGVGTVERLWDILGIRAEQTFSDRRFWPCETGLRWLRDELIPAVLASRRRQSGWKFWSRVERVDTSTHLTDPRSPDLTALATQYEQISLTTLIDQLQFF